MRALLLPLAALLASACQTAPQEVASVAAVEPAMADPLDAFTGIWGYRSREVQVDETGSAVTRFPARGGSVVNFETDFAVLERAEENMPLYKPEYWQVVRDMDTDVGNDPSFGCLPHGVPRMGPPTRIARDGDTLILLYTGRADTYRTIPTDGRELTEEQLGDITWKGYSSGELVDGKLVVTSKAFNDESWLGWPGWVHSNEMVVTESLWVEDDALHWFAKVDDVMLMEPWTTHTEVRPRTTDPNVFFWETPPCDEQDLEHMVDRDVRG